MMNIQQWNKKGAGVLRKKKGDDVLNRIFHRKRQMSGQSQGQIAYHNDDNNNNLSK
jgi:hypothetical protein